MRPIPLLTLFCAALVLAILLETRSASFEPATQTTLTAKVLPRPNTTAPSAAADTRMTSILARPLFTPDRRPPTQPTASAPPPADSQGLPRLTAIISGPFGLRAIIAGLPGRRSLTVSVGDQVQEFRVQRIDNRSVFLMGPTGPIQLRPTYAGAAAAPAPAFDLPPGVLPEDVTPQAIKGRIP